MEQRVREPRIPRLVSSPDDTDPVSEPTSFELLDLLQITDRSFPTGAFVHSHGLEWLIKNQTVTLEAVLEMRLKEQLAHFELVFLVQAYEMAPVDLDERFQAMVLPRESRESSMQV